MADRNQNQKQQQETKENEESMIQQIDPDEDPLLIAQTLTYVTDDGSVCMSFQPAPYSLGRFFINKLHILSLSILTPFI